MSTYWTNFAKTGNPNCGKLPIGGILPNWKVYDKEGYTMDLGDEVKLKKALYKRSLIFW